MSFTNTRVYYLLFCSSDRQVRIRDIPRWDRNPQIGRNRFFFLDVDLAAWTNQRLLVVSRGNWHTFWRHGISESGISHIMYSSAHLSYIVYYSWATSTYKCFLETISLTCSKDWRSRKQRTLGTCCLSRWGGEFEKVVLLLASQSPPAGFEHCLLKLWINGKNEILLQVKQ